MAGESRAPRALLCDTNVLVRILTDDPPAQARAAARALDSAADRGTRVIVTDIVVAELAYVLTTGYGVAREEAARLLRSVLSLPAVEVTDQVMLAEAIDIWTDHPLDFADAYLAALGRGTLDMGVLSFDRDHDRIPGVTRVDPREI